MKNLFLIFFILIVFSVFSISCSSEEQNYTNQSIEKFNAMKPPITLFSKKRESEVREEYSIILMDGDGILHSFTEKSNLSNGIGKQYNVKDTLKIRGSNADVIPNENF